MKIFRFTGILICGKHPLSPCHHEGRFAVVTKRGAGCDGMLPTSGVLCTRRNVGGVRRSRVVLAPRPWRLFGGKYPADNGDNKGRSPGRVRISRKTIARGKPGCLGCTCQTRVRSSTTPCTRCCGRSQRPAFPAPSNRGGPTRSQNPGKLCRGNENACLSLSLRAKAKQSSFAAAKKCWIASSLRSSQ